MLNNIASKKQFFSHLIIFSCLLLFNSASFAKADPVAKSNVSYVLGCGLTAGVDQDRLDRIDNKLSNYETGDYDDIARIYVKMRPMMEKVLAFQKKQSEDLASDKERAAYLKEIKKILQLCDKITAMNEQLEKADN